MTPSFCSWLSWYFCINLIYQCHTLCNYFYHQDLVATVQLDECTYSSTDSSSGYFIDHKSVNNSLIPYVQYIVFDGKYCPLKSGEVVQEYECDEYYCNPDGDPNDCKVAKITTYQFTNDKECNMSTYEEHYFVYELCFNLGIIGGQSFECNGQNGVNAIYYDNDDCSGAVAYSPAPTVATMCIDVNCNSSDRQKRSVFVLLFLYFMITAF